jgi:hypothetical protein
MLCDSVIENKGVLRRQDDQVPAGDVGLEACGRRPDRARSDNVHACDAFFAEIQRRFT